jgi:hypothetical protein
LEKIASKRGHTLPRRLVASRLALQSAKYGDFIPFLFLVKYRMN